MKPEREDVWVMVDGVGQPCLRWIRRGEPSQSERDFAEAGASSKLYGPYSWHRYALVPVRTEEELAVCGCDDGSEGGPSGIDPLCSTGGSHR